ncbi:MAG: hypothetical protein MJZ76_09115 [Bacteroidales bacterium]|nr:hypothetical protein [Bacteroidales bacterium]
MKKYLSLFCIVFILASCGHRQSQENIVDQSDLLMNAHTIDSIYATTGVIDEKGTNKLVNEVLAFAKAHPTDEATPELLAKAGGYCMRLANATSDEAKRAKYSEQAIDIFDSIIAVYPEHPVVKYCYWWKGIIYEDILQMLSSAENEYREFLHRFPDDTLAISIRYSLEHLGDKTPEVVLEGK